jgi:hypothetical protein
VPVWLSQLSESICKPAANVYRSTVNKAENKLLATSPQCYSFISERCQLYYIDSVLRHSQKFSKLHLPLVITIDAQSLGSSTGVLLPSSLLMYLFGFTCFMYSVSPYFYFHKFLR